MTYKDWRPEKLDVESIATDAQLTRIEAKLDKLLAMEHADKHSSAALEAPNVWSSQPICWSCGKPLSKHG